VKTLVAILAHAGYESLLRRHWPYYQNSGCDILGVGRVDKPFNWPNPPSVNQFVGEIRLGNDGYADGDNHLMRLIGLLEWFVDEPGLQDRYHDICIIEADSVFLGKLPPHPGGLCTTIGGFGDGRDFAPCAFFHTPWWVDRLTALHILDVGSKMLKMRLFERGFVDRWLGLMVELYGIRRTPAPAFSVNTLDNPDFIAAAREAVKKGAVYVHGVKTARQLELLTEP